MSLGPSFSKSLFIMCIIELEVLCYKVGLSQIICIKESKSLTVAGLSFEASDHSPAPSLRLA
jgi:hypothetical protein